MYKAALITGGTRGIGRAIAESIAPMHKNLCLVYNNDEESALATKKAIESTTDTKVFLYKFDLSNLHEIEGLVEKIYSDVSEISTLVNNAGVILSPGGWMEQSISDFERSIAINFTSVAVLTKFIVPQMIEKKHGRIINLSSTYAINGAVPVLSYTCAKSAVTTLTTALAAELGQYSITVNAIAPGNIDTDMTSSAGKEIIDWAISTTPIGRLGKAEEVGKVAKYLIESPFITGTTQVVDGGQILKI
ncbi:MAG: SDR family oxidoreductase [Alteromonadaceae bacterium]|nr:SDR family oxidoreductase [Alteromonadaceae bacterium]